MAVRDLEGWNAMVTAGCGFIGSHLVRSLLARGVKRLVVVDDQQYGRPANLGDAIDDVELVRFTIGADPPEQLAGLMQGVDCLFHLAAAKPTYATESSGAAIDRDIHGAQQLFEIAARAGVKKVVYTSSVYVYGRRSKPEMIETEVPRPDTLYGISKLACEHLLHHFHQQYGLDYTVLRLFFVYGPRQYAGAGRKSVIVDNFERILRGEPPLIRGNGSQVFDYVYVDDVVEALVRAVLPTGSPDVYNVGSGRPTPVDGLIDRMLEVAGRSLPALRLEGDDTADSYRVANCEKIKLALDWEPRVSLREGIERTFRWIERGHVA
jgi:UDP-glucose 4-epimerase